MGASILAILSEIVHTQGMLVLVADDEPTSLLLMRSYLGALAKVIVRENGVEAWEGYLEHRPDLVVLDLGMPGLSGHEVARRIRATPDGHRCRLLAMSASPAVDIGITAADGLWDGYLEKPVSRSTLAKIAIKLLKIVDADPCSP